MGVVWEGYDELLKRAVAVKEVHIPATLSDEEKDALGRRVLREARAAAQLNHRSAVAVYDVAEEDGKSFIIMELVTAPTLADLVEEEGPLVPERAAEIGLQVLSALGAAHEKGIVHRDVKPANVMVPAGEPVKLADFGIASVIDDPRLTSTGLILGSPAYMAPEQAQEREGSAATDLWGLGATLYFAVEGHSPFDKGQPIATLTSVINDDVEVTAQSGPLGPVLEALMTKAPAGRPDAAGTRRMLEEVAGGPAAADPAPLSILDTAVAPAPAAMTAEPVETYDQAPAYEPVPVAAPSPADPERPAPLRPAGRPKGLPWILVALALVVIAGAAYAIANQKSAPGDRRGSASGGPSTTPSGTPSGAPSSSPGAPAVVPAGWTRYRDATTGYRIAYPPGWVPTPTDSSQRIDFVDQASGSYLRVEWQQPPGDSPAGSWRAASATFGASHDNYQELRITPTTFQGYDAAEWEYTYTDQGADLHAIDLGFVTGAYGFALNFQTHAEDWDSSQATFEAFKAAFQAPG
jgi:hypothetical protein